jgi:hypothetical protein
MTELVQAARDGPAQGLPQQSYQSLPLPCQGQTHCFVVFIYCGCRPTPEGKLLLPPQYMAWIDAVTGTLYELRSVGLDEFGQQDDPNQFLGIFPGPAQVPATEVASYTQHLYGLYDKLLTLYFNQRASHEGGESALAFKKLFWLLSEPVLEPYYRVAGKAFFEWLNHQPPRRVSGNDNTRI